MADIINIQVLEDGTFKISTDSVSMPNHTNAEGLIKQIVADAGGEVQRVKKPTIVGHVHNNQWHQH